MIGQRSPWANYPLLLRLYGFPHKSEGAVNDPQKLCVGPGALACQKAQNDGKIRTSGSLREPGYPRIAQAVRRLERNGGKRLLSSAL
jgi:hypothetical protein